MFEVRNKAIEQQLNDVGRRLRDSMPAGFGFTLMIFSYGEGGSMFYTSSAERQDMINLMREFIQKHEHN